MPTFDMTMPVTIHAQAEGRITAATEEEAEQIFRGLILQNDSTVTFTNFSPEVNDDDQAHVWSEDDHE